MAKKISIIFYFIALLVPMACMLGLIKQGALSITIWAVFTLSGTIMLATHHIVSAHQGLYQTLILKLCPDMGDESLKDSSPAPATSDEV